MEPLIYPQDRTAYLLIDPYNDYLSEGGKIWPRVEQVGTQVGLLDYLGALDAAVQAAGVPVFIVPRCRWESGDCENWDHPNPASAPLLGGGMRPSRTYRRARALGRRSAKGRPVRVTLASTTGS